MEWQNKSKGGNKKIKITWKKITKIATHYITVPYAYEAIYERKTLPCRVLACLPALTEQAASCQNSPMVAWHARRLRSPQKLETKNGQILNARPLGSPKKQKRTMVACAHVH